MEEPRVSEPGLTVIEALTANFYRWERRGRGWQAWEEPVHLEPPFVPFPGHLPPSVPRIDDAKKPTAMSTLLDALRGTPPVLPPPVPEEPEPETLPDPTEDLPLREVSLFVPQDAPIRRETTEQFLRSLRAVTHPVSFEVVGSSGEISLGIALREPDAPLVEGQLKASVPDADLLPAPGALMERWARVGPVTGVLEFGLAREFMAPLSLPRHLEPDPLLPVLGALGDLGPRECALYQVLFEPTLAPWAESALRAVTDGQGGPFFLDAPELTRQAVEKLAAPLFAVTVRVGARAWSAERLWTILRGLCGALAPFGSPAGNELMPLAARDPIALEAELLLRESRRSGMLLSSAELVSLVHPPAPSVRLPALRRDAPRTKAAPEEVQGEGVLLGVNVHRGAGVEVRLPMAARLRHTHLIGASGTGKTTLIIRLVLQDLEAGYGVAVFDPHGDLIEEILARMPEGRLGEVVLLDPADPESTHRFNPLEARSEAEQQILASDLVGVFRRLSTSWGGTPGYLNGASSTSPRRTSRRCRWGRPSHGWGEPITT